jgi:uncharacterized protein
MFMVLGLVSTLASAGCNDKPDNPPTAPTSSNGNGIQSVPTNGKDNPMTANKQTVQKYMDAFNKLNHADVLSCLTDDVEWVIPGMFHKMGKDAFDKEIENDAFVGTPKIIVTRMTEENNVVIAEGSVQGARKDGGPFTMEFCDVFVMQDGKIKHLTSYLMEVKK